MYEIIFDKNAIEFLNKLDYKLKERIFIKIISTKEKPFRYFQKLVYRDGYKLRVGNYRVIADIDKNSLKIKIRLIMHRKNIYEKLQRKVY
jgi:mRNA interferase RelE/StbE